MIQNIKSNRGLHTDDSFNNNLNINNSHSNGPLNQNN